MYVILLTKTLGMGKRYYISTTNAGTTLSTTTDIKKATKFETEAGALIEIQGKKTDGYKVVKVN